ncbi:MAG: xanthine dehydrogenase small subunit [Thermoanaerobaculia bacterium]
MRHHIRLMVNGTEHHVGGPDVFLPLADFLRGSARATGTKVVCAEGDCGACTVLVGRPGGDGMDYRPLNACILFLYQLDGTHVITVEGLGYSKHLSPVQESMVDNYGSQCGYCTPGFVVAMTALAESPEELTPDAVRDGLTGNLCRCTGYDPIIKAAIALRDRERSPLSKLYPPVAIAHRLRETADDVMIIAGGRAVYIPVTIADALRFKAANPNAVVVQGGTDINVQWNKRGIRPSAILSLSRVPGLDDIVVDDGNMLVGGRVRLSDLQARIPEVAPELHAMLGIFGSPQIRNAGTLAGNIANASPIADTLPFLFVTGASVELSSTRETRTVPVNDLYRGYKQLDMAGDELITRITIPLPAPRETLRLYKVSKRRDLDISTFTAAIRMTLNGRMNGVRIAYGGVAPVVLRLPKTESLLEGKEPTEELFRDAGTVARSEISPITDVRGSAQYRSLLGANILMKFYFEEVAGSRREAPARA